MVRASISETVAGAVLNGPLLLALILAAAAGALSFFSPCCLPLVPGYLSYITGVAHPGRDGGSDKGPVTLISPVTTGITAAAATRSSRRSPLASPPSRDGASAGSVAESSAMRSAAIADSTRRAAATDTNRGSSGRFSPASTGYMAVAGSLFVFGFAVVFTSYGLLFGSLGMLLLTWQDLLVRILGVVTIVMGLIFAGILQRMPVLSGSFRLRYRPRTGLAAAPLVGAMFGLGWTPCMGPTLGAVLSLAMTTGTAARGAMLSMAYSLGLGLPFVLAALGLGRGLRRFGWARSHGQRITQIGGAFLVLLGLLQVSGTWTAVLSVLRSSITGYSVPL